MTDVLVLVGPRRRRLCRTPFTNGLAPTVSVPHLECSTAWGHGRKPHVPGSAIEQVGTVRLGLTALMRRRRYLIGCSPMADVFVEAVIWSA